MSSVIVGLVAGVAFGVIDVLLMIPLDLPNKKLAMIGAFANRFVHRFFDRPYKTTASILVGRPAYRSLDKHSRCNYYKGICSNIGGRYNRWSSDRICCWKMVYIKTPIILCKG